MKFRKERNLKPLSGFLAQSLKKHGLFDKMKESELFLIWDGAVGAKVAAHARPSYFKFGRLYVSVDSSAWLSELNFLKAGIIKELNGQLGQNKVRDIVLKAK
jgi:predicted nucleic acid-binding Zn ribbon protein